jgi:hypothetical protein
MSLQHLPLTEIKEADLQRLISDTVSEKRSIEYKRDWPRLTEPEGKREFLADIASFANAAGGDLIYGMEAINDVPVSLIGLADFTAGSEKLTVQNLLAAWIDPRIAGVDFHDVSLANGKTAFIIRVPRSWSPPHMVTFNGWNRFYSRHANGKYQLDVNELRTAFLQGARAVDRIRDFRLERINRIVGHEIGVTLPSPVCLVWHLMPLTQWSGFDYATVITKAASHLRPMGNIRGFGPQINLDGCMVRATDAQGVVVSYVQMFRDGCIEAVLTHSGMQEHQLIYPHAEGDLRWGLHQYRQALHTLGISAPYIVALSLLNVGGFAMYLPSHQPPGRTPETIDRPHLLLPETVVESETTSVDAIARPLFDLVWNACGCLRSQNYDEVGKWIGDRR